jgi:formylglycine-generating enzyme required for sulfatase activity/tRNA A-37 threonylcarbamoyl transferase component Bud32
MLNTTIKDYLIQSELGRGGMAVVYLALDNKFDTNVAIKLLNKEYVHNDNFRKRFLAEAKNMFRMSHPNIIKVTDLIDDGNTVAFVMEYIEGETLKEYLGRKDKLGDAEIKSLITQMLDALGYVHEQKLVHRDIKPANFMIAPNGKVKLMDFGIAKNTDASIAEHTQTGTGVQMGTPMYMSPEQIAETKSVTAQSDIYSLGVVLWQMVIGRKPYDMTTLSNFQLQLKIVNEPLENTNTIWDRFIRKATAKDIALRYSNAAEFKKCLLGDSVKNNLENEATFIENDAKRQIPPTQNSNSKEVPLSISNITAQTQNNTASKAGIKTKMAKLLLYFMAASGVVFLVKDFTSSDKDVDESPKASPLSGELAIEWADIPAGTFTMGSPQSEDGRGENEMQHDVTLDGFKMSKYEITIGQFAAFVKSEGYITDAEKQGSSNVWDGSYKEKVGVNWRMDEKGVTRSESDFKHPVLHLSWNDAKAFADWAGAKLPTEAQWEYACRAGTQMPFNTGRCLTTNEANYNGNYPYNDCNSGMYKDKVMPVGIYAPNTWGLFDMHGNVWEWCTDWYGDYLASERTNPQGPSTGSGRVMRGGSWLSSAQLNRSASRSFNAPDARYNTTGFRLVSPSK